MCEFQNSICIKINYYHFQIISSVQFSIGVWKCFDIKTFCLEVLFFCKYILFFTFFLLHLLHQNLIRLKKLHSALKIFSHLFPSWKIPANQLLFYHKNFSVENDYYVFLFYIFQAHVYQAVSEYPTYLWTNLDAATEYTFFVSACNGYTMEVRNMP